MSNIYHNLFNLIPSLGLPCGSASKESACNVGELGLTPGLGRSPGEGKGYPLQYSGLENSMGSKRVGHNWVTFTFSFICQLKNPRYSYAIGAGSCQRWGGREEAESSDKYVSLDKGHRLKKSYQEIKSILVWLDCGVYWERWKRLSWKSRHRITAAVEWRILILSPCYVTNLFLNL